MPQPQTASALDFIFPDFVVEVERFYRALMQSAVAAGHGAADELSLGGQLLYAGEFDAHAQALLVAANIAGCASLTATSDTAAQRQGIRDGVADFLVNSLDEALRILKNEIRKRETVAVCIASPPEDVVREMQERGVVPDLFRPVVAANESAEDILLWWRVAAAPAQWLPKLDAIALSCLESEGRPEVANARRWLRLAPRYLGRRSQGVRILRCQTDLADEFVARIQNAVKSGEIAVEVEIGRIGSEDVLRLQPSAAKTK